MIVDNNLRSIYISYYIHIHTALLKKRDTVQVNLRSHGKGRLNTGKEDRLQRGNQLHLFFPSPLLLFMYIQVHAAGYTLLH